MASRRRTKSTAAAVLLGLWLADPNDGRLVEAFSLSSLNRPRNKRLRTVNNRKFATPGHSERKPSFTALYAGSGDKRPFFAQDLGRPSPRPVNGDAPVNGGETSNADYLLSLIKDQTAAGNIAEAEEAWTQYISLYPFVSSYVDFAKWAEFEANDVPLARSIFEKMLTDLNPLDVKQPWVFKEWASFEERQGEYERYQIIYNQLEEMIADTRRKRLPLRGDELDNRKPPNGSNANGGFANGNLGGPRPSNGEDVLEPKAPKPPRDPPMKELLDEKQTPDESVSDFLGFGWKDAKPETKPDEETKENRGSSWTGPLGTAALLSAISVGVLLDVFPDVPAGSFPPSLTAIESSLARVAQDVQDKVNNAANDEERRLLATSLQAEAKQKLAQIKEKLPMDLVPKSESSAPSSLEKIIEESSQGGTDASRMSLLKPYSPSGEEINKFIDEVNERREQEAAAKAAASAAVSQSPLDSIKEKTAATVEAVKEKAISPSIVVDRGNVAEVRSEALAKLGKLKKKIPAELVAANGISDNAWSEAKRSYIAGALSGLDSKLAKLYNDVDSSTSEERNELALTVAKEALDLANEAMQVAKTSPKQQKSASVLNDSQQSSQVEKPSQSAATLAAPVPVAGEPAVLTPSKPDDSKTATPAEQATLTPSDETQNLPGAAEAPESTKTEKATTAVSPVSKSSAVASKSNDSLAQSVAPASDTGEKQKSEVSSASTKPDNSIPAPLESKSPAIIEEKPTADASKDTTPTPTQKEEKQEEKQPISSISKDTVLTPNSEEVAGVPKPSKDVGESKEATGTPKQQDDKDLTPIIAQDTVSETPPLTIQTVVDTPKLNINVGESKEATTTPKQEEDKLLASTSKVPDTPPPMIEKVVDAPQPDVAATTETSKVKAETADIEAGVSQDVLGKAKAMLPVDGFVDNVPVEAEQPNTKSGVTTVPTTSDPAKKEEPSTDVLTAGQNSSPSTDKERTAVRTDESNAKPDDNMDTPLMAKSSLEESVVPPVSMDAGRLLSQGAPVPVGTTGTPDIKTSSPSMDQEGVPTSAEVPTAQAGKVLAGEVEKPESVAQNVLSATTTTRAPESQPNTNIVSGRDNARILAMARDVMSMAGDAVRAEQESSLTKSAETPLQGVETKDNAKILAMAKDVMAMAGEAVRAEKELLNGVQSSDAQGPKVEEKILAVVDSESKEVGGADTVKLLSGYKIGSPSSEKIVIAAETAKNDEIRDNAKILAMAREVLELARETMQNRESEEPANVPAPELAEKTMLAADNQAAAADSIGVTPVASFDPAQVSQQLSMNQYSTDSLSFGHEERKRVEQEMIRRRNEMDGFTESYEDWLENVQRGHGW